MANQVRVGVSAPGAKGASSDVDNLRDRFERLQKTGAKGFMIGAGAAVTTAALNLVGNAVQGVTNFLGDASQAYQESQISVNKLDASLKANVAGWNGNTDAIESVLHAREQLAFSDEDTRNSLSLLVGATHDVGKALDIQSTAMDLARFKGISLADASEALTKVEAGSYRILKSLGITLRDGATQTEALAAVQKIAGGQAAKYADSDLAKVEVAQIKVNDSMEKIGRTFSKVGSVVLPAVAGAFEDTVEKVDRLSTGIERFAGNDASAAEKAGALADALFAGLPFYVSTEQRLLDAAIAADKLRGATGHIADDWMTTDGRIKAAAETIAGELPHAIDASQDDVSKATAATIAAYARSLQDGYDDVFTAATRLTEAEDSALSVAEQMANLRGVLFGEAVRDGLASSIPGVRAQAEATAAAASAAIIQLGNAAYGWGVNIDDSLARGIKAEEWQVILAAKNLSEATAAYIRILSPAKKGAWSVGGGPEGWGRNIGKGLAKGIRDTTGDAAGAAGGFAQGVPFGGSPGNSAFGLAGGQAAAQRAGDTHYHLTVQGNLVARDKNDVLRTLGRMRALGRSGALAPVEAFG